MPEEIRAPGPAMIQPQRNSGAASRWEAPHKLRAALALAAKTLSCPRARARGTTPCVSKVQQGARCGRKHA
jgi:hypothetical protein